MTAGDDRPAAGAVPRAARFAADRVLAACLAGVAALREGMAGGAVMAVQQALMDLGYALADYGPDGVYGLETAAAVAAFQADADVDADLDADLDGDGVLGRATLGALDERFASEPPEEPEQDVAQAPPAGGDGLGSAVPDVAPPPLLPPPLLPPRAPSSTAASVADATAQAASITRRAVEIALAQARAGAHVLAAAAGATPGEQDGCLARPGGVTLVPARIDPVDPAVFTARLDPADGAWPHVCAGRFNARNGGIGGGRPAASTDTDLIVYLAGLAALPEHEWTPFFQFFSPRRAVGGGTGNRLAWGEDCRHTRHFDGPGLLNWCFEQAVGARYPVWFDAPTWATDASGTVPVPLAEPPRTGDVLLRVTAGRVTHLGLLAAPDGAAVAGPRVVLAEHPGVGVVVRRFSPASWTLRRRASAALLHA